MERLISYRLISQGKSEEVKVNCKYYDGCYDLQKFDFIPRGRKVNNQSNFFECQLHLTRLRAFKDIILKHCITIL